MLEQPSLDGLERKAKRSRKTVQTSIAASNPIAHIMLDVQALHLGKTFDYLVSQSQDEIAQPGSLVRVKFGASRVNGIIWGRSDKTSTPKSALKFIDRVLPGGSIVSNSMRNDICAIAEAYGGTPANIIRLAIPPRVASVDKEQILDSIHALRSKSSLSLLSKKLREYNSETVFDGSEKVKFTTDARMEASYSNVNALKEALQKVSYENRIGSSESFLQNASTYASSYATSYAKSFVVDALPGSFRWAQDLAWIITTAISSGRKACVVLPTLREVNDLMRALMEFGLKPYKKSPTQGVFSGDVARLCAADSPADRYRSWKAVAQGLVSCVLGTRAAMYAPVEGNALFVIVEDCAYQYADGMVPYAQARGVMKLRAKTHNGVFVSMSYMRSAVSQWEIQSEFSPSKFSQVSGKSTLIAPLSSIRKQSSSWVRVLNREALIRLADSSIGSRVPHTAVRVIRKSLDEGYPVLLSIPADGVTQAASCEHCHAQARCKRCTGPLDISEINSPRCKWCGASALDWTCANCGSNRIRALRVGAAGTAQELRGLFRNVPVLLSSPHQPGGIIEVIEEKPVIVVATPGAEPRVKSANQKNSASKSSSSAESYCFTGEYKTVAILDAWNSLYSTGLDARIDTLNAWMRAAALCAPKSRDGSVLLIGETYSSCAQTLSTWNPSLLASREINERSQAGLPPSVCAACVWGARDAVMKALHNIGAIPSAKENSHGNENKSVKSNEEVSSQFSAILPMISIDISADDSESSVKNSHAESIVIPPLLGVVPMHPPVTDNYQHFDELDDRVKAVVRVPLSWRQELVDRLLKEVAHHIATRAAGELRFCVDPKDLLAY